MDFQNTAQNYLPTEDVIRSLFEMHGFAVKDVVVKSFNFTVSVQLIAFFLEILADFVRN